MSIHGKSVKSVRKKDLTTQKTPFVAFKSFSFAHQANAGDTTISLTGLTTPTSYSSAGFLQPSASDLQAANLLLYKRNLQLVSSLKGLLLEYDAYQIVGSTTINLNFEADQDEIFVGIISDVAKSGLQVVDANPLVSTGVLTANTSDYVVGQSFARNKYPSQQVGDVLVFLGGELVFRNAGNATASVSADGNYEELDGGSDLSNTIRFNIVDPLNDRPVVVVSNGLLAERADGSLKAEIESLAGQLDSVIETLAIVAGVPESNFQSAPNNVDLQTFGQRVINVEAKTNFASISQIGIINTSDQTLPGNKTIDGILKSNTRFMKYKSVTGNITSTAQTSTVDVGTLDANLSYIDIPRTGLYRVLIQAGATGTTVLSNGIRLIMHIRRSASLGSFASGSQIGTRAFNQSQNGNAGSTNRPYAMCSTEFIGSLNQNDRIYFALDYYDNPNSAGTLGGGTMEAGVFIVEELTATAMS